MKEPENRPGRERTLESLTRLVAALDRRVPHAGAADEQQVALAASELRGEATLRIGQLHRAAHTADVAQELSDEVMTDDGAPLADNRHD